MAGPSSISGVGANLGFIPGPDYSPIAKGVASIVAAHEQKKQNAAQEFDRLMKAVDMGLPVDPKQIEKTLKKSGINLMAPDEMKAHLQAQSSGAADKLLNGGGATEGGTPGTPGAQPTGGDQSNPVKAVAGAKQTQQQAKDGLLKGFVDHAMAIAKMKGETQENQLKLNAKLSDLKLKAANGDANALGQLMAVNEVPFNLQAQAWSTATTQQRQKMMDVARGAESEKDFNIRKDAIYGQLMQEGKFKDPSTGMKAAEIIAKGGELPSEIRNSMSPNSMGDLVKESQLANQLIDMGVPPEQVGTVAANAQKVGLSNALPTGLKPLATRQIELEEKRGQAETERVGLEKKRYEAETAHYTAMAAAMDAKMKEEAAKADLEQFKALAEVKKLSPGAVTDDMINAAQTKAMRSMGWTETETKGFWNYVTFGMIPTTNRGFRPQLTSNSRSNIDQKIGGGSTSDSSAQGTVGAIGNSIKKNKARDGSDLEGEN